MAFVYQPIVRVDVVLKDEPYEALPLAHQFGVLEKPIHTIVFLESLAALEQRFQTDERVQAKDLWRVVKHIPRPRGNEPRDGITRCCNVQRYMALAAQGRRYGAALIYGYWEELQPAQRMSSTRKSIVQPIGLAGQHWIVDPVPGDWQASFKSWDVKGNARGELLVDIPMCSLSRVREELSTEYITAALARLSF